MQIYLARDNQQAGPYTLEQLNSMLANQQVLLTDLIWHAGMKEWKPVAEVTQGQFSYYPDSLHTPAQTPLTHTQDNHNEAIFTANSQSSSQTSFNLAPLSKRAVAKLVDLLLWLPAVIIPQFMLSTEQHLAIATQQKEILTLLSQDNIEQANQLSYQLLSIIPTTAWVAMAVYLLLMFAVQAMLIAKNGQSIGKKMLALQIVDANNQQLVGLNRAFILRSILFSLLNIFIFPLIFIIDWVFALGKKRQALHDMLAKTIVVEKK